MQELVNNLRAMWITGEPWMPVDLETKELIPQKIKICFDKRSFSYSEFYRIWGYPKINTFKFRSIIRKDKQHKNA